MKISHVLKTFSRKRRLIKAYFDPALACNLRCKMCPWREEKHGGKYFPAEEFETLILMLQEIGLEYFVIGANAEPLIHPKINQLLDLASQGKFKVEVLSNLNCRNAETLQKLKKVDCIYTSIDGGTKESYEDIRVGGNWELICENIRELSKYTKIVVSFVLLEENYRFLPNLVNTLNELNAGGIQELTIKYPTYNHCENELEEFRKNFLKMEQLAEFKAIVDEIKASAQGFKINFISDPKVKIEETIARSKRKTYGEYPCIPLLQSVYIDAAGNTKPCCLSLFNDIRFGNILESDLISIYKSKEYHQIMENLLTTGLEKKPDFCATCIYDTNKRYFNKLRTFKLDKFVFRYVLKK